MSCFHILSCYASCCYAFCCCSCLFFHFAFCTCPPGSYSPPTHADHWIDHHSTHISETHMQVTATEPLISAMFRNSDSYPAFLMLPPPPSQDRATHHNNNDEYPNTSLNYATLISSYLEKFVGQSYDIAIFIRHLRALLNFRPAATAPRSCANGMSDGPADELRVRGGVLSWDGSADAVPQSREHDVYCEEQVGDLGMSDRNVAARSRGCCSRTAGPAWPRKLFFIRKWRLRSCGFSFPSPRLLQ